MNPIRNTRRPGLATCLVVVIAVFVAVSWYQTRDLLDTGVDLPVPEFRLTGLDGTVRTSADLAGRPAIIYFFAPWCRICNLSADNLQTLRQSVNEQDLEIVFVALAWDSVAAVKEFAKRNGLTMPILLGNEETARDFRIRGVPTYYVLNSDSRIVGRDFGYTTNLGLRFRVWRTD